MIAAIVVGLAIVATFVGMNMQHAKDMRDEQSGVIKPSSVPMTEKDLGKTPVQQK
jgi:multisubunit Na+/H+ antiporter MnhC subunit